MVLDLETTGGAPTSDAITEIGAVKVRGGERLGELATLVDPGTGLPPNIVALTGITTAMVTGAPRLRGRAAVAAGVPARARCSWRTTPRSTPGSCAPPASGTGRPGRGRRCCARRGWPGPCCRPTRRPACGWARWPGCSARPPRPTHRALADARRHRRGAAPAAGAGRQPRGAEPGGAARAGPRRRAPHRPDHGAAAQAHAGRRRCPRRPGCTCSAGPRDEVLYVGTSGDLRRRVRSYFTAGRAAAPGARHGGAGRAGRHRGVRARAGGRGARAAADRGPPAPLQPPLPRARTAPGGSRPTAEAFPRLSVVTTAAGRARWARSAPGRRPSPPSRPCSTPCRCAPCTQRIPARGAGGQPVRAARAGPLRAPRAPGCRPRRVRARRRARCTTWSAAATTTRCRGCARPRSTAAPPASGSRTAARRRDRLAGLILALGRAQRLAALAARRRSWSGPARTGAAAGRSRCCGTAGSPRPGSPGAGCRRCR